MTRFLCLDKTWAFAALGVPMVRRAKPVPPMSMVGQLLGSPSLQQNDLGQALFSAGSGIAGVQTD